MESKKTRLHPNKAKHSRAKQTKAEERAQRLQGGRTVGWSETIGYKIDSYLFNNYPSKAKPSSIRALLDLCVFHTQTNNSFGPHPNFFFGGGRQPPPRHFFLSFHSEARMVGPPHTLEMQGFFDLVLFFNLKR